MAAPQSIDRERFVPPHCMSYATDSNRALARHTTCSASGFRPRRRTTQSSPGEKSNVDHDHVHSRNVFESQELEKRQGFFEAKGFNCIAPSWPLHEGDPADRNNLPTGIGDLSLNSVIVSMESAAAPYDDLIYIDNWVQHRGAALGKGLTIRGGQTHVQHYTGLLLEKIAADKIDPAFIITHRLCLDEGPGAYKTFRDKKEGCIKVVLKP